MKPQEPKRHLVMAGVLLFMGSITLIRSNDFISSVSELNRLLGKSSPRNKMYTESISDALRIQGICLILIIFASVPFMIHRASLAIQPHFYRYQNDGSKDSFLLFMFHEKMLRHEFINGVVYLTLFIFVFCLFDLECYKSENVLIFEEVFPIPSKEEVKYYSKIFENYGKIFRNIKTALILSGEGFLILITLTVDNIQYHYKRMWEINDIRRP